MVKALYAEPPGAGQTVTVELEPSQEHTATNSSAPLTAPFSAIAGATVMTSATAGDRWQGKLMKRMLIRILVEFLRNLERETRTKLPSVVIEKAPVQFYKTLRH